MKHDLIEKFRNQLELLGDQTLILPEGYENDFWEWFEQKSYLFESSKIRKKLRITDIPIIGNFCYKNSYRIAKGFMKRLLYYEGFCYSIQTESATRHAFSVCKHHKVNDYSLTLNSGDNQDYYVGVKIPLAFCRRIYREKGDFKHSQYSLIVAYYMYEKGIDGYQQFTEP